MQKTVQSYHQAPKLPASFSKTKRYYGLLFPPHPNNLSHTKAMGKAFYRILKYFVIGLVIVLLLA